MNRLFYIISFSLIIAPRLYGQKYQDFQTYNNERPKYKQTTEQLRFVIDDSLRLIRNDVEIFSPKKYVLIWEDVRSKDCKHIYTTDFYSNKVIISHKYCNKKMQTEKIVKIKDTLQKFESGKFLSYKVVKGSETVSGYKAYGKSYKTVIVKDTIKSTYFEYINDTLTSKTVCFKNHKANTDSSIFYDGSGELLNKEFYSYDEKGNCTLEQKIEPHEKFADRYKTITDYKYDDRGNWIEKKVTRKNSSSLTLQDGITKYSDTIWYYTRTIVY